MGRFMVLALVMIFGLGLVASVALADQGRPALTHQSKGYITLVNPARGIVLIKQIDARHTHRLLLTGETLLLDEEGYRVKALQVGDYVQEECLPRSGRPSIAKRIVVLRPAWRMYEIPEQ
ncbi:MAG: hypothetical protein HY347_11550 [candidate division NC10 bacterium]|nr:hypothetical protein [candidate division NC10 bacterium]